MLASYLTGLVGIAVVLAFWLTVQSAWRRSFPPASDDPDALAGRVGCHGCDRSEACDHSPANGAPREEEWR